MAFGDVLQGCRVLSIARAHCLGMGLLTASQWRVGYERRNDGAAVSTETKQEEQEEPQAAVSTETELVED